MGAPSDSEARLWAAVLRLQREMRQARAGEVMSQRLTLRGMDHSDRRYEIVFGQGLASLIVDFGVEHTGGGPPVLRWSLDGVTATAVGDTDVGPLDLTPVTTWYGTQFNTGYTDLVPESIELIVFGSRRRYFSDVAGHDTATAFTYSTSTGCITFAKAPFQAGMLTTNAADRVYIAKARRNVLLTVAVPSAREIPRESRPSRQRFATIRAHSGQRFGRL